MPVVKRYLSIDSILYYYFFLHFLPPKEILSYQEKLNNWDINLCLVIQVYFQWLGENDQCCYFKGKTECIRT